MMSMRATKNQIEQRKKMAQKSALKLVKDAWDNDQAVEKTVASQRQRYAELDAQRTEAKKALAGYMTAISLCATGITALTQRTPDRIILYLIGSYH